MANSKSKVKYIRMDPDLEKWIHEQAEKENRSFRNYVETALQEHRARKEQ